MSDSKRTPETQTKDNNIHRDSIADVICSSAADRDKCEQFVERLREANNNIQRTS